MKTSTIFCLGCLLALSACARQAASSKESATSQAAMDASPAPADVGPPPAFDSDRAMRYVKEIVALGPRPIGSENHRKVEESTFSRI